MRSIRNFCIIAHIDHGKSTLADRFLEITSKNKVKGTQVLDTMDLEQERWITIKLTPARMEWKGIELNLIDTPWHVDFQYEVSRSLAAVEWCVLLVDASQWIQAQTLSTLYMAMEHELTIIPVLNKIDLPAADPERRAQEIENLLGIDRDEIIAVSAKTWMNVDAVLDAIVERINTPDLFIEKNQEKFWSISSERLSWILPKTRALIFDSVFDPYKWVVTYVKVLQWSVSIWDTLVLPYSQSLIKPTEVWHFSPWYTKDTTLSAWQIWYILTWQKSVRDAQVWDTFVSLQGPASKVDFYTYRDYSIPWFKKVKPFVFSWIYPVSSDDYDKLKIAFEKLALNDSAISVEPESSLAMGQWFRCWFLWTLHMDIIKERLSREYDMETLFTMPTVTFLVAMKNFKHPHIVSWMNVKELITSWLYKNVLEHINHDIVSVEDILQWKPMGKKTSEEILTEYYQELLKPWLIVSSWWTMPDQWMVDKVLEPMVSVEIVWPDEFSGNIMWLAQEYRWVMKGMEYIDDKRVVRRYQMPMSEIIIDFYDTLKSTTKGYATMNYEFLLYQESEMVRVDIFINSERVEAFSMVVHNSKAYEVGKKMVSKLKDLIPKHLFAIPLQAWIWVKMIARETIPAMRKDVIAKCYGWDVSRKKKLLKKQKEWKKKMKQMWRVSVPWDVFIKMVWNN